jgi:hypothetical protein
MCAVVPEVAMPDDDDSSLHFDADDGSGILVFPCPMFAEPDAAQDDADIIYFSKPITDRLGRKARVSVWIHYLAEACGWDEAEELWRAVLPTASGRRDLRNFEILSRHDRIEPPDTVYALACRLAEENKLLPPEKRWARGTTDPAAMNKHIRRLVKMRNAMMKKGTWHGPGAVVTDGVISIRTKRI